MENETKIASLIDLIKEDRIEVREIKKRMYSMIQSFVIATIAITAFSLDCKSNGNTKLGFPYLLIIDSLFIFITWIYFFLTKLDLKNARQCLKGRQNQLTRDFGYNYFEDYRNVDVDIKDNELYWIIGIASVIYLVLIIITICIMN